MREKMTKEYKIGVLGASGAVGREVLNCLEDRGFPFSEVVALASERSAGSQIEFNGTEITVQTVTPDSFKNLDLAIFSAGATASSQYAPIAAKSGCPVIDNSSFWRNDDRVPLVVPEVNPRILYNHKGIIANPNCSTIQM
ncbi:MAG: aspartate-semialdehyde dehydrogenase, partial [Candidatus Adiutrix sp.]